MTSTWKGRSKTGLEPPGWDGGRKLNWISTFALSNGLSLVRLLEVSLVEEVILSCCLEAAQHSSFTCLLDSRRA